MPVRDFRDLRVYQAAFIAAMDIFRDSQQWPAAERYSLTDQVRRSSRSVCANIAEAYRKRRYPAVFISKLSDADAEAGETLVWIQFARASEYLSEERYESLSAVYRKICSQLVLMMNRPEVWCKVSRRCERSSEP